MNYQEEIEKIMQKRKELQDQIDDLKERWTKECPIEIGDTVAANGYVYVGQTMIVDSIVTKKDFLHDWHFLLEGRVFKKDGSPSKLMAEHIIEIKG